VGAFVVWFGDCIVASMPLAPMTSLCGSAQCASG
jgi:hypothetical protein